MSKKPQFSKKDTKKSPKKGEKLQDVSKNAKKDKKKAAKKPYKRGSKTTVEESVLTFINNLLEHKPQAAKVCLNNIITQKIKQRIINNNNVKPF